MQPLSRDGSVFVEFDVGHGGDEEEEGEGQGWSVYGVDSPLLLYRSPAMIMHHHPGTRLRSTTNEVVAICLPTPTSFGLKGRVTRGLEGLSQLAGRTQVKPSEGSQTSGTWS